MTYTQAVQDNLRHMGTPQADWQAVQILGTEDAETDAGDARRMPVFAFPSGYTRAPSLFASAAQPINCELCGTPIKIAYWLQNDRCRWTLMVGSECVTHFGAKSGEQIARQTRQRLDRQLLRDAQAVKWALHAKFSFRGYIGYGRYQTTWKQHGPSRKANELWNRLSQVIGPRMKADAESPSEPSSDGAVTRWANKHRNELTQLLAEARNLLEQSA